MNSVRSGKTRRPWRRRFGLSLRRLIDALRSQFSSAPLDRCRWMRLPSARRSVSDDPKDRLARAGEEEAATFLEESGFTVLHRNVRFPEGELDLVAGQGTTLVFVEVKTRRGARFGSPEEAVDRGKQRRQTAAASRFLSLCRLRDVPVRFDIVTILWPDDGPPEIGHFPDAFRPRDLHR